MNTTTMTCESDDKIERLLNSIFFTVYTLQEEVDFANPDNYRKTPLIVKDVFFS
jgi:hypothetical protein